MVETEAVLSLDLTELSTQNVARRPRRRWVALLMGIAGAIGVVLLAGFAYYAASSRTGEWAPAILLIAGSGLVAYYLFGSGWWLFRAWAPPRTAMRLYADRVEFELGARGTIRMSWLPSGPTFNVVHRRTDPRTPPESRVWAIAAFDPHSIQKVWQPVVPDAFIPESKVDELLRAIRLLCLLVTSESYLLAFSADQARMWTLYRVGPCGQLWLPSLAVQRIGVRTQRLDLGGSREPRYGRRRDRVAVPPRETPDQIGERLATQAERIPATAGPILHPTDHERGKVGPVPDEERREGGALSRRDRLTDASQQCQLSLIRGQLLGDVVQIVPPPPPDEFVDPHDPQHATRVDPILDLVHVHAVGVARRHVLVPGAEVDLALVRGGVARARVPPLNAVRDRSWTRVHDPLQALRAQNDDGVRAYFIGYRLTPPLSPESLSSGVGIWRPSHQGPGQLEHGLGVHVLPP